MILNSKTTLTLLLIVFFNLISCDYSKKADLNEIEEKEESEIHTDLNLSEAEEGILKAKLDTLYNKKDLDKFSNILLFEDTLKGLYQELKAEDYNLDFQVFRYAMIGYYSLKQEGRLKKDNLLSIIDYTKESSEKRFYTIDLHNKQFIFYTHVAHGKNTGGNIATSFSDTPQSLKSSIGFYLTGESYIGSKGYSMRLDGDEVGYNSNIRNRAIVMHTANYVSQEFIKGYGRLGRSYGCPVLPKEVSTKVINTIKDRSVIFAYYNDDKYLKASKYLDLDKLIKTIEAEEVG